MNIVDLLSVVAERGAEVALGPGGTLVLRRAARVPVGFAWSVTGPPGPERNGAGGAHGRWAPRGRPPARGDYRRPS